MSPAGEGNKHTIQFTELKLIMKVNRLHPEVRSGILKQWMTQTIKYPLAMSVMKTYHIATVKHTRENEK